MVSKDGYFWCNLGEAGLSKIVQDELLKAISNKGNLPFMLGHTDLKLFYCPNCTSTLSQAEPEKFIFCKKCNLHFPSNVIYHLIEHTGHKKTCL